MSYWHDGELVVHNYASGVRASVAPQTMTLLGACGEWRSAKAIARETGFPEGEPIEAMLGLLVEAGFVERSDAHRLVQPADLSRARARSAAAQASHAAPDARAGDVARAYDRWNGWNPVASFFHASTKDVPFAEPVAADEMLREKAVSDPPPPMVKRMRAGAGKGASIALPEASPLGGLDDTLMSRRTWRRFGAEPVSRADLATLLHLTWGVQQWMQVEGFGKMPLKTSPSGGARHSIEAYAFVRHVEGVKAGLYHYGPDDHQLRRVEPIPSAGLEPGAHDGDGASVTGGRRAAGTAVERGRALAAARRQPSRVRQPLRKVSDYLPTQTWYDDAAVVVFMTAIFARAQWRYGYPRAYRSILAEAGHLAQTFCLVATRLGLAPFCSMALADSLIERDLGIDGVSESVVYCAGVGSRPEGVEWAPWPDTDQVPRRSRPAWKKSR